jgi:hypothetical protein
MLLLRLIQIPILGYIAVLFLFVPYSIWKALLAMKSRISSQWMLGAFLSALMFVCGIGYCVVQH